MNTPASEYFQYDGQNATLYIPESFNFAYDVADRIAREDPQRPALVWVQDESCSLYAKSDLHERVLTFVELCALSNQAAQFLISRGVKKGDRVMLLLKRHYAYWYTLLALHKIGAVALPAVCMLNGEDLVYRIQSADISAIICLGEQALCEKIAKAAGDCGSCRLFSIGAEYENFERMDTGITAFPPLMDRIQTQKEDPLLLYFTSGTTGLPKMVVQDGTYPLAHIQTAQLWQNVKEGGLHLSVADTGWAKASWGKIYGQWLCGSAVLAYDYDIFSAVRMLEVICKYKVTTFCAPPTIYRFLVKNNLLSNGTGFGEVQYASTAGEAIHAEIVEQFYQATGLTIHVGYGQTESALLVADFVGAPVRPGAMGRPSPLYHPIIIDANGKECAQNEPGEIVLPPKNRCAAGLCSETLCGANIAETVWRGHFYHTGDIAYRDEDGYFWFIGRVDDVIKSSGYRISPFEIESVLIRHPAVADCAVTSAPDDERGFVIKATVVLNDGYTPDQAMTHTLRKFVKDKTADYKVPRVIHYVSKLPRTFSGKIRHAEIRRQDALLHARQTARTHSQASACSEEK